MVEERWVTRESAHDGLIISKHHERNPANHHISRDQRIATQAFHTENVGLPHTAGLGTLSKKELVRLILSDDRIWSV